MATCDEMSSDALRSAAILLHNEHFRSSVSRAYYAANSAITSKLNEKKISFSHGWNNPGHDQLEKLVINHLTLSRNQRYTIRKSIVMLRTSRENADYRSHVTINKAVAVEASILSNRIITLLKVVTDDNR